MADRPLYGLVLAGGRSSRMGRDKAMLRRNGASLLAHTVDLLASVTERVFVSARPEQSEDPLRSQFELIIDRYDNMGPIAGILSALESHPEADWLVVACDLPNVDDNTLNFLLDHRAGGQQFTAFRSSHDGLPEPLCAIYPAGSEKTIRQCVAEGIACPRKILIRSDTLLLQQPDPRSLDNVNTPEDLAHSVLEAGS